MTSLSEDGEFLQYLAKYGKSYGTKEEYAYRKELFDKSRADVAEHNSANGFTFTIGINKFADMSEQEIERYMGEFTYLDDGEAEQSNGDSNVSPVDWRTVSGVVGAIKDQGSCGGCWSFSATGVTEGRYHIATGNTVILSEQQLIDCSSSYGNSGCNGGLAKSAYDYIAAKGQELGSVYPYVAKDQTCAYDSSKVVARSTGTAQTAKNAAGLKDALATGPVSVSVYASANSFLKYTGGIINDTKCGSSTNHAIIAVGWGTDATAGEYVIVRNSWGASWGESGYARMSTLQNTSAPNGICALFYRQPSYPTGLY